MSVMSKYDCSLHVVMVVLKAFDVDTRKRLDILQVNRHEDMKRNLVCAVS
jgi:hypothetical protein